MAEKLHLSPPLQDTEKAAKLAILDAQLADLFADMDQETEEREKERERKKEVALKKNEQKELKRLPQTGTVYVDVNAVMAELATEFPPPEKQKSWDYEAPLVQMPTEESMLWTIPNIEKELKGDWSEITYEPFLPSQGPWKEDRDIPLLTVAIRKEEHNALAIEMKDLNEDSLRQIRLKGLLLPVIQPGYEGRLSYLHDERFLLHPTAEPLVDVSLTQFLDVVKFGQPRHIEFYDRTSKNKPQGMIGFHTD